MTASAEVALDLYGGIAFTQDADVTAKDVAEVPEECTGFASLLGLACFKRVTNTETREAHFNPSIAIGGRPVLWFERVPQVGVAIAIDLEYLRSKSVDILLYSNAPQLMVRWPFFPGKDYPTGRIQPYAAAGPSLFVPLIFVDFRPDLIEKISWVSGVNLGWDVRAGLKWKLENQHALFVEYRAIHVKANASNRHPGDKVETRINSSMILFGFSYQIKP
jgi:hypothetical protein